MKIAIASSGLAHVTRGIETWALDTARALQETGVDTTLFCNTMPAVAPGACVALNTLQRNSPAARRLARSTPGPLWRAGFKSTYGWEQARFWKALKPQLVKGGFDILHVQDPMVAWWCKRARARGRVATREILAHGTEEPARFLGGFDYLQHLAPWHQSEVEQELGRAPSGWCSLPNFVETDVFRPDQERAAHVRDQLGIPRDAFVVGCAAALKCDHKRIDYLIGEVAACGARVAGRPLHLLLCGATQSDTAELRRMGAERLGSALHMEADCPRGEMPGLLAAMDLFALGSLFEMMPIAVLEALSAGRPMLLNDHPVLRWMGGADDSDAQRGADCIDMREPGALTQAIRAVTPEWLTVRSTGARARAERMFSREAVIRDYITYYAKILDA